MAPIHQLSRRSFLTDLGKGTIGVAILSLAACSPSSESSGSTPSATSGPTSAPETSGASGTAAPDSSEAPATAAGLQWERADLGNVSAYVLARGSELAIVDTGNRGSEAEILRAMSVLGGGWNSLKHVIITHSHGDHIGSLSAVLEAAPNAMGYAGTADLDKINAPETLTGLSDGDEVFGLQILGTPGHTPGHISVYDAGSGLMVAGDALNESAGQVLAANERFTPDMALANQSVKRLAEVSFETLLVGHGEPVFSGAGAAVQALAETL